MHNLGCSCCFCCKVPPVSRCPKVKVKTVKEAPTVAQPARRWQKKHRFIPRADPLILRCPTQCMVDTHPREDFARVQRRHYGWLANASQINFDQTGMKLPGRDMMQGYTIRGEKRHFQDKMMSQLARCL